MRRSLSSLTNPGIVGAALAIHRVATVEDFEILRRIVVVKMATEDYATGARLFSLPSSLFAVRLKIWKQDSPDRFNLGSAGCRQCN